MGEPVHLLDDRTDLLLSALRRGVVPLSQKDGLMLLYGHPTALVLGLYAAADRALAGETVLYLDGANAFDPFVISRMARTHRVQPRTLLTSIHVARAFTCHQMERLVSDCLAAALSRYQARVAVLSGPLETFYDEAVSSDEVTRLLKRMITSLQKLSRQGYRVLCLCPSVSPQHQNRYGLLMRLQAAATRLIRVEEAEGMLVLNEETAGSSKQWQVPCTILESV